MKLGDLLARLDRVQRGVRFKAGASAAVLLVLIGSFVALAVAANEPGAAQRIAVRAQERAKESVGTTVLQSGPLRAVQSAIDSVLLTMRPISEADVPRAPEEGAGSAPRAAAPTGYAKAAVPFVAVGAGALAVIWIGLGLAYLALLALGWGLAWPLMLWPATSFVGGLLVGSTPLVLAFLTGVEVVKLALNGSSPILAVARNLVQEAVRMKISLVFIVMLILLLASVPGLLDPAQQLRYRVQQWLQYGSGLSYAILVLLTLFLSVATVSFEQRDKVIWQTMTKPVAHWQYLLGKWIGVMAVTGVLLAVTASGVYLFTEFLRREPASGEIAFNVRDDGTPTLGKPDQMVEDRRLLESQVLVARVGRRIEPLSSALSPARVDRIVEFNIEYEKQQDSSFKDTPEERARIRSALLQAEKDAITGALDEKVKELLDRDPNVSDSPELRASLLSDVLLQIEQRYRTIPPGGTGRYLITGLKDAKRAEGESKVTLLYKLNAGSNDPSKLYNVRFLINRYPFTRQIALSGVQSLLFDSSLIRDDGTIDLEIQSRPDNDREITFPPEGLEVLYVAGGYELNFIRIVMVMWIKLGFIAAVGIATATFLSFPVACLVTIGVVFCAESAGYLNESLEVYTSMTKEGIDYVAVVVRAIAIPIAYTFKIYADLRPTESLVDGRLIGWGALVSSMAVLGAWTLAVLGLGLAIFRQRELATYSGR